MRVVFLTHYFPPELGAAQTRIAALARGLAERGIQVTVHTGHPHYPSGVIPSPHRNRLLARQRDGDVRIVRSIVYAAPNRGFSRRLADHAAFAAGALATAAATGPADAVVAESPPLFTAAAAVGYARAKRARLALNVADLWPESAVELGALSRGGPAAGGAGALARLCYRRADVIATPTRGIFDALSSRPEARGKVAHVPPAVDLDRFATAAATPPPAEGPLRVLYAGTLGLAQGLSVLVDAAAIAGPDAVRVLIAGEGPVGEELERRARERGLSNVEFVGPVPPDAVPALYASVHAGVVPLLDRPVFEGALPTKLFEVMASGRPVIAACGGEAAALVRDAGAGLAVAPEDPEDLAAAFQVLRADPGRAADMGRRGRVCAENHDRGAAVDRWARLLTALVAHPSGRAEPGPHRVGRAPERGGSTSVRR